MIVIRPSLGGMVRISFKLFVLVAVVAGPLAWWKGRTPAELLNGLMGTAAAFTVLALFLALVVRPLGLRVYPTGLVGRTFWGPRKLLPWQGIAALQADHASGVTLIMITSTGDGPTLWTLPDVIEHPELQRLAWQFAGADNPIVLGDRSTTEPGIG